LNAHARGNATTADLVSALTAAGNPNTAAILESFTTQAGIPSVVFQSPVCNSDEGHPDVTMAIRQSRYAPLGSSAVRDATWALPVCVTYADAGGVIQESCAFLTEAEGNIELATCPVWVLPNPRGESYFRFSMQPAQMAALQPLVTAAVAPARRGRARTEWTLGARGGVASARDLITMSDSARAGFASGETSFESAMNVLAPMVTGEDRFVATAPIELLSFAHDQLLSPAEEETFFTYARRLYQPQFARLGWAPRRGASDDSETRSLRAAVLRRMHVDAHSWARAPMATITFTPMRCPPTCLRCV
jgi:alanyl aminopeptidase